MKRLLLTFQICAVAFAGPRFPLLRGTCFQVLRAMGVPFERVSAHAVYHDANLNQQLRVLAEATLQGDENSREKLMLKATGIVFPMILRRVSNQDPNAAVDVLQDVLATFSSKLSDLDFEGNISRWIARVAKFKSYHYNRKYLGRGMAFGNRIFDFTDLGAFSRFEGNDVRGRVSLEDESLGPQELFLQKEFHEKWPENLEAAFNRLSERRRDIVRMRLFEGLGFLEIGEKVGRHRTQANRVFLEAITEMRKALEYPLPYPVKNGPRTTHVNFRAEKVATPNLDALSQKAVLLKSPRLILRTPKHEDMKAILPIFNDRLTVRYTWFLLPPGEEWTLDGVLQKFESFAVEELKGTRRDFVIQLADTSKTIIGRCALYPAKVPGSWELGITIDRPYWGQEYAKEVMTRIFQHAFTEMGVSEIWFQTEPENFRMLRQYEKMGIPKIVDAEDDIPAPPLFHQYHQFLLTRERWEELSW